MNDIKLFAVCCGFNLPLPQKLSLKYPNNTFGIFATTKENFH